MLTEGPSRQAGRHEAGPGPSEALSTAPSGSGPPDPQAGSLTQMSRLEEDLGQIEKQLLARPGPLQAAPHHSGTSRAASRTTRWVSQGSWDNKRSSPGEAGVEAAAGPKRKK